MDHTPFLVLPNTRIYLKDYDPGFTGKYKDKESAEKKLKKNIKRLRGYQEILWAQSKYSLLLVFQGMDTAGKDSTVKFVMTGINPMGCRVVSFKTPSAEELKHDYWWRCYKNLPERGQIGIFVRSYYEEVIVVRVHPEILEKQNIPAEVRPINIWENRFETFNNFEKHLAENGTIILKFFLHISKDEQKERFFDRINRPEKNWKFSMNDIKERGHWDDYMKAYEEAISKTSTSFAPWYIIPADHKWFTRVAVSSIINTKLKSLKLNYPTMSPEEHKKNLLALTTALKNEEKVFPTISRKIQPSA